MTDKPDPLVAEPVRCSCTLREPSQRPPNRLTISRYDGSMSDGKLTTLACVLAILGFGACGGGPYVRPSPPPLPPVLAQVQTVAVQVEDTSGQDLVNVDLMSRRVASAINQVWKGRPIHLEARESPSRADAGLKITILHKTFSCAPLNPAKFAICDFFITSSISIKASNGQVLWHFEDLTSHFTYNYKNGFPSDGWGRRDTTDTAAMWLASDISKEIEHFTPSRPETP